jgi:chromosome segregation ATPase
MANRSGYFERDRRGRERVVITDRRRSSSQTRLSTRELLNAAEEREKVLIARNANLQTRLSWSQANEYTIRNEHQTLVNEHYQCRHLRAQIQTQSDAIKRLEERLEAEQDKTERLEERNRLLLRTSHESYRQRYEEKCREVASLKAGNRDRDELILLNDTRIAKRDQKIAVMTDHLRRLGFSVID